MDLSSATWRKSSYSGGEGGQCVELADLTAIWRRSSHSGQEGGNCVEVADLDAAIGIRDSKNPDGPALLLTRRALATLLTRAKSGALDM